MIEGLLQHNDLAPEVLAALREHQRIRKNNFELPSHIFELPQYVTTTLLDWSLPPEIVVAMLLAPLLEHHLATEQTLARSFNQEAIALAKRLVTWHIANSADDESRADSSPAYYSMQLRRLLRQAYLDLPKLSFILLLLAEHNARLSLLPKSVAAQTEAVFVPFTEMLGMWELRRQWLDKSLCILYESEYEEMTRLIKETGLSIKEEPTELSNKENVLEEPLPLSKKKKERLSERKVVLERNQAYSSLNQALTTRFQEENIDASIHPIEPSVGTALYRHKRGEAKEELINRLVVRIVCSTIPDCYRVLGVVHHAGKLVAPRFSERFSDHIASPQPNGYRALNTAIIYNRGTHGKILVDFRILTAEMYNVNERGIVAALYNHPSLYHNRALAWWNKLAEDSEEFRERQTLLESFDFGTRSDPIYVFTNQGEIACQEDGSTALDFAYYVHTELGHHAVKIEVNGKPVPYNYPLHNGDLVHVHHDPHFIGPDLAWLGYVHTPSAKNKIRKGLATRARAIHEGRSKIEYVLIRMLQFYRKEKKYDLIINTSQLDTFLFRAAQAHGFLDRETLYTEVALGHISPHKLVQRLISEELSSTIVDNNGDAITVYPLHHIHFCNKCCPVPGEPIIALERQVGPTAKGLIIHRAGNQNCQGPLKKESEVPIRWAEPPRSEGRELLLLQIGGEARDRLLGDIINCVYREPEAHLRRVSGQADGDNAEINLAIEADTLNRLVDIQAHIETVHGVRRVFSSLPSFSQRLALKPIIKKDEHNPYTYQEVYDRLMFYDRESSINAILDWLKEPLPTRRLILHGQRRVGKTSLAKYLMHEILPEQRLAQPIWLDFQDLSQFNAQSIANYFVQSVYDNLQKPVPQQQVWEEPMPWLNRALEEAIKQRPNTRLLILLDEFNVLLDMEHKKRLDPVVFANLRSVMSKRRDLSWLLIVQDTHFHDPKRFGSAGSLFQQSLLLQLPYLDSHWANKLITEPAQRCGILYEKTIPAKILDLTNGNPYLIQVLCHELLRRIIKQHRANITDDDLNYVINLLTNATDGPRIFHHFVNYLEDIQKIVLAAVAHYSPGGEWMSEAEIIRRLQQEDRKLRTERLSNAIKVLEHQGILVQRYTAHVKQVCIPIKLFQGFVEDCMDVQTAIEEWKANQPTRTRRKVRS